MRVKRSDPRKDWNFTFSREVAIATRSLRPRCTHNGSCDLLLFVCGGKLGKVEQTADTSKIKTKMHGTIHGEVLAPKDKSDQRSNLHEGGPEICSSNANLFFCNELAQIILGNCLAPFQATSRNFGQFQVLSILGNFGVRKKNTENSSN